MREREKAYEPMIIKRKVYYRSYALRPSSQPGWYQKPVFFMA